MGPVVLVDVMNAILMRVGSYEYHNLLRVCSFAFLPHLGCEILHP